MIMRLPILTLMWVLISLYSQAQQLAPISKNEQVEFASKQSDLLLPNPVSPHIQLRNTSLDTCNGFNPGTRYVSTDRPYTTLITIDTTGLDTLSGTFNCVNCDDLQFGSVVIEGAQLTYTVNPDVTAGLDSFSIEFL